MSNIVELQQNAEKAKQEQPEEIRIEVITHEDTNEILTMLKEFFFKVNCSIVQFFFLFHKFTLFFANGDFL